MRIYIVEREGGDGLETDCFESIELAQQWCDVCGGILREEKTWDDAFTQEMIETYTSEEV